MCALNERTFVPFKATRSSLDLLWSQCGYLSVVRGWFTSSNDVSHRWIQCIETRIDTLRDRTTKRTSRTEPHILHLGSSAFAFSRSTKIDLGTPKRQSHHSPQSDDVRHTHTPLNHRIGRPHSCSIDGLPKLRTVLLDRSFLLWLKDWSIDGVCQRRLSSMHRPCLAERACHSLHSEHHFTIVSSKNRTFASTERAVHVCCRP